MFHPVPPRRALFLTALVALGAVASPASAVPLLFSLTGGRNGSFQVDSNPVPNFLDATSFSTPVTGATGDFSGAGGVEFYLPSGGGGLASYVGPGNSTLIGLAGPQLFTGTLANPVFGLGLFKLEDPATLAVTNLTITGPGAPAQELAAGWMAAFSALAALALVRLRRPLHTA